MTKFGIEAGLSINNKHSWLREALGLRVGCRMTIRIQKASEGHKTILRLSGELVSSKRQALLDEMERTKNGIALDLEEVTLVDLETVQLLVRCEARGIEMLNCPPYIREWMSRERDRAVSSDER